MTIGVVDFCRSLEGNEAESSFFQALNNPTFYILARVNGKIRELVLKLSGSVPCPAMGSFNEFELESYRSYLIIANFLLGEDGERVRRSWGLSRKDFKDLIFKLYCALIREHATCSFFKKILLFLLGAKRFFAGRRLT